MWDLNLNLEGRLYTIFRRWEQKASGSLGQLWQSGPLLDSGPEFRVMREQRRGKLHVDSKDRQHSYDVCFS